MKKLLFALMLLPVAAFGRDVTLAWDDYSVNEPGAAGINVYTAEYNALQRSCTAWVLDNNLPLPATDTQYTVQGLDDALSYCFEIRGVDTAGVESAPSNVVTFIQYRQLSGPTGLGIQ